MSFKEITGGLSRCEVPGGWIYLYRTNFALSTVFVPRPKGYREDEEVIDEEDVERTTFFT